MDMETAFITPFKVWEDIGVREGQDTAKSTENAGVSLFQNVFRSAIDAVKETEADKETKQYLLATGQLDDAHSLPIAETKAALTLDVLITLRNKTLEAYNDLIKINV